MSTGSRIGYELPDHSILNVYCHWDGHPEANGRTLVKYFSERNKVKDLINGGNISVLRTSHTWETERTDTGEYKNTREFQPLYYTERGDDLEIMHNSDLESFACESYNYVYTLKGKWQCYRSNGKKVRIPT